VAKHNRRVSTIAEVWEFLHAFVVEAARTNTNLEEDGTVEGIDVSGLVGDLYIRGADLSEGLVYNKLAHSLGITWMQVESIAWGWHWFNGTDWPATLGEWPRLGRQLRYAYLHALRAPDAVCSVPWPGRLPNPSWDRVGASGSILWLSSASVATGTQSLTTRRVGAQYSWFNSSTRAEGMEPTEYLARIAAEDNLAQYVDALQGVL
jgi:hypothetical protein